MLSPAPDGRLPTIRMATLAGGDADAYARHLVEHMAESGRSGSPHFALSRAWSVGDVQRAFVERLAKGLDEPLWGRAWLLVAPVASGRRVVGHIELRGGRMHAEMHRSTLGMGLMRSFTGQGYGPQLVQTAVRWARDEAGLRWVDLGVFANNAPARKLYARMGFVEVGIRKDAFRLEAGPVIDDIQMTLALR